MGTRLAALLALAISLCGCGGDEREPFAGLADQVATLASSVDSEDRSEEAETIAEALDEVADRAQRGEFENLIATMQAARSAASGAIDEDAKPSWHPWSQAVDLLLWSYHRDDVLVTPRDAARALRQISLGLKRI